MLQSLFKYSGTETKQRSFICLKHHSCSDFERQRKNLAYYKSPLILLKYLSKQTLRNAFLFIFYMLKKAQEEFAHVHV